MATQPLVSSAQLSCDSLPSSDSSSSLLHGVFVHVCQGKGTRVQEAILRSCPPCPLSQALFYLQFANKAMEVSPGSLLPLLLQHWGYKLRPFFCFSAVCVCGCGVGIRCSSLTQILGSCSQACAASTSLMSHLQSFPSCQGASGFPQPAPSHHPVSDPVSQHPPSDEVAVLLHS